MPTGDKERKVIHRAVRVLDEIETRIHELREELEANGMTSPRGRKAKADEHDDNDDEGHAPARGRKARADHDDEGDGNDLHGAAKAAHDAKSGGQNKGDHDAKNGNGHARAEHEGDDDREPHGQGRVKHPETDKRLKGNHGAGDELHGAAKSAHEGKAGHDDDAKGDDDREPNGQGRVKHPENDKRVKASKD